MRASALDRVEIQYDPEEENPWGDGKVTLRASGFATWPEACAFKAKAEKAYALTPAAQADGGDGGDGGVGIADGVAGGGSDVEGGDGKARRRGSVVSVVAPSGDGNGGTVTLTGGERFRIHRAAEYDVVVFATKVEVSASALDMANAAKAEAEAAANAKLAAAAAAEAAENLSAEEKMGAEKKAMALQMKAMQCVGPRIRKHRDRRHSTGTATLPSRQTCCIETT